MSAFLIDFDLPLLSERFTHWFGCRFTVADVRQLLRAAGFEESAQGWLATDLRTTTLAFLPPGATLF